MRTVLWRASLRYQWRHPWQFGLAIVGVAIGVAVVLAIDLSNESANQAFRLSIDSVTGKATHQIIGGPKGVPEEVYADLRVNLGFRRAAPLVESFVAIPAVPGEAFHLLGVDPFAEPRFRQFWRHTNQISNAQPTLFLATDNATILSKPTAEAIGCAVGDTFQIRVGGKFHKMRLAATLMPGSEGTRDAVRNLILTDIATAQDVLDMRNYLSQIDLILPDSPAGEKERRLLVDRLPVGMSLVRADTRSERIAQMTTAFSRNLQALSLLALVVGMFLIYNAMTFSVVQRRWLFGALRALGVTGREIFKIVLLEALLVGALGTLLGLFTGVVLAKSLLGLVSQTINDLYFVLRVTDVVISPSFFLKGILLGLGATLISAVLPAHEATETPARFVMNRSKLESKLVRRVPALTTAGLGLLLVSLVILLVPSKNLLLSFAGLLPLVVGVALLTPAAILIFVRLAAPIMKSLFGISGKMSARAVVAEMSRSGMAVAALAIAVATTVGVGTMVSSFRETVASWLQTTLDADIYISSPGMAARQSTAGLDSGFVAAAVSAPEVAEFNLITGAEASVNATPTHIVALRMPAMSRSRFRFKEGKPGEIWPAFMAGEGVIISEPYAYKNDLHKAAEIDIVTDEGLRTLPVLGIFFDYATDVGLVMMSRPLYLRLWHDDRISGLSLYLKPAVDEEAFIPRLRNLMKDEQTLLIRSNRKLREASLRIFDRTFAITNVLRLLTILVAFIGVLSALMALQLERSRQLGVLRANGLTPGELWGLVTLQTGLMGLIAGLIALPFGLTLAYILIFVINKRSFGWTLQMHLSVDILLQALLLALGAALLAGVYPAFKMAASSPALALREE